MVQMLALCAYTSVCSVCLFPSSNILLFCNRIFIIRSKDVCNYSLLSPLLFSSRIQNRKNRSVSRCPYRMFSGQRGPLWWAAHHRRHHRHSDAEDDVHSPHTKSLLWSHTLWFMTDYAVPTFLKEIPDWLKFAELRFLN